MADAISNADLLQRLNTLENELKVQKQMADANALQQKALQQQVAKQQATMIQEKRDAHNLKCQQHAAWQAQARNSNRR
jgi:hypothetical protein